MRLPLVVSLIATGALALGVPVAQAQEEVVGTDVSVVKSGPSSVGVGDDIEYSMVVANNSDVAAESVVLSDQVPDGTVATSSSSGSTSTGDDDVSCTLDNGSLRCETPLLDPGEEFTVGLTVVPNEGTEQVTNTATVETDTFEGALEDNSSTVITTVGGDGGGPVTDLDIDKTTAVNLPAIGDAVDFTITVENLSDLDADDVLITDPLPAGYAFAAAGSDARCSSDASSEPEVVTCDLGTLAGGATDEITLRTEAVQGGVFTNIATVSTSTPEDDEDNNASNYNEFAPDQPSGTQSYVCSRVGTPAADTLVAQDDDEVLCGRGGNDTLQVTASDKPFLAGEGGDDTLVGAIIDGGLGNDVLGVAPDAGSFAFLDGGPGTDRVSYATTTVPITAVIPPAFDQVDAEPVFSIFSPSITFENGPSGANHVLGEIEDVNGGTAADVLTGSDERNVIRGQGGADVIDGQGGSDTLRGVDGDDDIFGGLGSDTIEGGGGADEIDGQDGGDTLDGGPGADAIAGGADVDLVTYGASTAGVTVTLDSGSGNDGAPGEGDTVETVENVTGSGAGDTITGNAAANVLTGNSGNDTLDGGLGVDTLFGNNGNDLLRLANTPAAPDSGNCGAGVDRFSRDAQDTAIACETLVP